MRIAFRPARKIHSPLFRQLLMAAIAFLPLVRVAAAQEADSVAADAAAERVPADAASSPIPAENRRAARDPYKDLYRDYRPAFLDAMEAHRGTLRDWFKSDDEMRLSTERHFFTLNIVHEDSRANALVEAGLKKEAEGQFREALVIYQQIIEKYPEAMYRVSQHGVYVPVAQYCQRRILGFPESDLDFYRQLYDARARETFEQARRQYSLLGLSEVANAMLATSYGGPALLELGNAALDAGHYLAALEYFASVEDFVPDKDLRTPELALKIAYCRKMLGQQASGGRQPPGAHRPADADRSPASPGRGDLSAEQRRQFEQVVASAEHRQPPFHSQRASDPHVSADDYTLLPPTRDPLGLTEPVWNVELAGSRRDNYVYSQPVVTENSVIYRHKNIVYCRSILNGNLRWENALGGRAVWQSTPERQYPMEDVLVQDGLVFTAVSKAGPSLVALDETTGQLRWAYGPMAAADVEQSRMRFECAPAGGPRTVYAGYILDNIEGETHTDSEYGVMAFDSATGRVHWRAALCRLAPGKFAGGFAEQRRNRIRSFSSPPLYHEGTVYYCTNAGAIAALDAMSGRIKWLMHYPYYPELHDATRQFGGTSRYYPVKPHSPMFWYNQKPLLIGEKIAFLPVDSRLMFCVDRRDGRVEWSKAKGTTARRNSGDSFQEGGECWLVGQARSGHLVFVYADRDAPVHLVDPDSGETAWVSGDLIARQDQPILKYRGFTPYGEHGAALNGRWYCLAARPLLTQDDKLHLARFTYIPHGSYIGTIGWTYHLGGIDLAQREKLPEERIFLSGEIMSVAARYITDVIPRYKEELEALPNRNDNLNQALREAGEVVKDTIPRNEHGPFLPFSRVTFERYGEPFELRFGPRNVQMVYHRGAVTRAVAGGGDARAAVARTAE
ncbi:MAG: PQQ-binding-like beta-propeller repeat protein [Planctomycetaceae bacterium]